MPDYLTIIQRPMHFELMAAKNDNGDSDACVVLHFSRRTLGVASYANSILDPSTS